MLLVRAMDEGPLLAQTPYDLPPNITTPELTKELIEISFATLSEIIPLYLAGIAQAAPQPSQGATYSRKLSKKDSILDWSKPATQLEREIRAFMEWPKSRARLGSVEAIITKAHLSHSPDGRTGDRLIIDKKPAIVCSQDTLVIDSLKPAGKQEMTGEAFLAGYREQFLS
jgi:methionyl-tRNA formyltransferase